MNEDLRCLQKSYVRALQLLDAQRERLEKAGARISELESECQNHVEHIAPFRQRMERAEFALAQLRCPKCQINGSVNCPEHSERMRP